MVLVAIGLGWTLPLAVAACFAAVGLTEAGLAEDVVGAVAAGI